MKILMISALLLMNTSLYPQNKVIKPTINLKIGDEVPDIRFEMVNDTLSSVKLSDFKGKLVILDFWATWCGSCISKFPEIKSLQQKFDERVKFILVNTKEADTRTKVNEFLRRKSLSGDEFALPTAIQDTVADFYFPHIRLPHYVWISPEGKVVAITGSAEVTEQNINAFIQGTKLQLDIKRDKSVKAHPLFLDPETELGELEKYIVFKRGWKKEYGQDEVQRQTSDGTIRGLCFTNIDLLTIYRTLVNRIKVNEVSKFSQKRLFCEIKDLSQLVFKGKESSRSDWERENVYSFEYILQKEQSKQIFAEMLGELGRSTPYFGRFEKRQIPCLKLIRTNDLNKIKTAGGNVVKRFDDGANIQMKNVPIAHLIKELDKISKIKQPIVDATFYMENIDFQLPKSYVKYDIEELRRLLKTFDLDLKESFEELEVFVLSDRKNNI